MLNNQLQLNMFLVEFKLKFNHKFMMLIKFILNLEILPNVVMTECPESKLSCDLDVLSRPFCPSISVPGRRALSSFVTDFVLLSGLDLKDLFEKKLTMREGVMSSWAPGARPPSTGVVGALPRLHAFSYDVSKTTSNTHSICRK